MRKVKLFFVSDTKLPGAHGFCWRRVCHLVLNWRLFFLTQTKRRIEIPSHHSRAALNREKEHLAKRKTKCIFLGNGKYVIDGRHFPEYIRKRKTLLVFKIKIRNPFNLSPHCSPYPFLQNKNPAIKDCT